MFFKYVRTTLNTPERGRYMRSLFIVQFIIRKSIIDIDLSEHTFYNVTNISLTIRYGGEADM